MRIHYILYVVGALVCCVGLSMLFPLAFGVYYGDDSVLPLVISIGVALLLGLLAVLRLRSEQTPTLSHREGMAIVAMGWMGAGLFGALPFLISGYMSPTDAVFESVSGFTTTGASILTDIESLPEGLLMWRSMTQWLGGMGIIVLSLAILPFLGVGGMQLYKAEVPGPAPDKLKPRIKDTAMLLWKVYLVLSVAEVVFLLLGGMSLFDAISHTFTTLSSGGFSTRNASIAAFDSVYIDAVITLFMFMAGMNFVLHFRLMRGDVTSLVRDSEFRFYAGIILLFTIITTLCIWDYNYDSVWQSLRLAAFQVVSICTTTGYATADYELWLPLPQALLFFLMFLGGSAGSTAGGMKCMRILLLLKQGYHELLRLVHPRAVKRVKLGGRLVAPDVLSGVVGFFILYLLLYVLSSFIMTALGLDILTAFASVAACIGNVGPGLGSVGPAENYAHIPTLGKWVLVFNMLLGRLEIYTVIILFVPEFWRK
ncbi:TrkH family potassium uptake protein [Oceanidesulfovibrio indonesiensis]|uniref:TrkH family potassium uptake protein n=1 Tax=Oceanidesulfovibrio indonesiensis TaxID=54767 RepID=A0A7M3MC63_9BACT|nr:TrkH family potassium uptake protein [Oceanidesulfovibrio indonesiensis]TVM15869.1 TrkH family potassium uptake protein [Oceanidesulfovibrio indonesiensis]